MTGVGEDDGAGKGNGIGAKVKLGGDDPRGKVMVGREGVSAETWLVNASETATKRSVFGTMFLFGKFARLRVPRAGLVYVQKEKRGMAMERHR